jgi:uncharacterized protein (TIGR03083 family)
MPDIDPNFAGPWPDALELTRAELASFIDAVSDGASDDLPTRCQPWTVRDVTVHVAETFKRFARMTEQGRVGDFTPPFAREDLDQENLRAVAEFDGDAVEALREHGNRFLDLVDPANLDEPIPHQMGVLPIGLQINFGLMDLAVHHDDVEAARGGTYAPPSGALDAIVEVAHREFGMPTDLPDPWPLLIMGSGRTPAAPPPE